MKSYLHILIIVFYEYPKDYPNYEYPKDFPNYEYPKDFPNYEYILIL
jgi:hypothetical protein